MKYILLLGRIFFALIFLLAVPGHFTQTYVGYASAHGVPLPSIAVPLSGIIALLGAVSVILGYKTRYGAWLLVIFLVPVTLTMHNFWTVTDPAQAGIQKIMFLKNLSMLGGALMITYFGSGPLSLDKGR